MNFAVCLFALALVGARLLPPPVLVPDGKVAGAAYYEQIGHALASWSAYPAAEANYRASLERDPERPTARLSLARCLLSEGRPEDALREVQTVLKLDAQNHAANRMMGELALGAGRAREAEQILRRVVQRNHDDSIALRLLGFALLEQRRPSDAELEFRAAIHANQFEAAAYQGLAQALMLQNRGLAAMNTLRRLLEFRPGDLNTMAMLAELYVQANRYEDALEIGLALVSKQPDDPRFLLGAAQMLDRLQRPDMAAAFYRQAYPHLTQPEQVLGLANRLAQYYSSRGQFKTAAEYLRRVVQLKPALLPPRIQLAQSYALASDFTAAAGAMRSLTALQPNSLGFRMQLFEFQLRAKAYTAARATANTVLRRWPQRPELAGQLAEGLYGVGRRDDALQLLEDASRRAPKVRPLRYLQYQLLDSMGRTKQAEQTLTDLLKRFPDDVVARHELAALAYHRLDYARVIHLLEPLARVGRLQPDAAKALGWSFEFAGSYRQAWRIFEVMASRENDPLAMQNVARQAEHLGEWPVVQRIYQGILSDHPKHVPSLLGLGRALGNQGQVDQADVLFVRVIELAPKNALAWRNHAFALMATGRLDESMTAWQKLAELDPSNPYPVARQGDLELARRQTDEATKRWLDGLQQMPRSAVLHRRLADELAKLEHYPEAIGHYVAAARSESQDWSSRLELARLSEQSGLFSDARRWWRELIDIVPDTSYLYRRWLETFSADRTPDLGLDAGLDLLSMRGDSGLAEALVDYAREQGRLADLSQRLRAQLAGVGPREAYGRALLAAGDDDAALAFYQRLAVDDPQVARWRASAAQVLEQRGRTDDALQAWREAAHLAPLDTNYLEALARCQLATGQVPAALGSIRRLAKLAPDETRGLERLARQAIDAGGAVALRDGLAKLVSGDPRGDAVELLDHAGLQAAYGLCCEQTGQLLKAAEAYHHALALNENIAAAQAGVRRLQPVSTPSLSAPRTERRRLFDQPTLPEQPSAGNPEAVPEG